MKLATLCYVRTGTRTLMLHRVKNRNDMHAGKWNGLGGKLEPGETPEECAIREVYEESGLRAKNPAFQGVLTFPQFSQGEDWYVFVFVIREFSGDIEESPEGHLAWVENERLDELNLWPGDRIFMRWLETGRHFSGKFVYRDGQLEIYHVAFHSANRGYAPPTAVGDRNYQISMKSDPGQESYPEPVSPQEFKPAYQVEDDGYCWLCHGPVTKRHCKIVCLVCGFTRDCSDP